ncbi:MAG: type II toxin-antitoxin system ParD family antitoxin [Xanthomonadales bacterium]|nr:type II toxin-antitoxin system ParD family antitoxin [Xanthomonadales bacterium]
MAKNTSVSLGDHFENFVDNRVKAGRYSSASDAVRAGLRLLEQEETRLDFLRETLAKGERQLDQGQGIDGEAAFTELMA